MSRRLRCSAIIWALLLVTCCGVPAPTPPPTTATATTIRATSDGGRSWVNQYTAPGIVSALDFVSVRHGCAATQAGLITTRDGGTTWERVGDTTIGRMDFVDAEHGWAVAGAGYN